ncbi:MAG: hypothetical protein AAGM22_18285 [Acidobacteriota bacterium]
MDVTASVGGDRLGEFLLREGRLSESALERAVKAQGLVGGRLGTNLLELGLVTEGVLLETLGRQRASCTAGRAELARIPDAVLRSVPEKLARRHRLVPYLVRGKTLFVASADPGDLLWEDEISFLTSFMVRTCVALELHVNLALRQYYKIPIDRRFLALAKRLRSGGGAGSTPGPTGPGTAGVAPAADDPPPPSARPAPRPPNPFDVQATPAPGERPTATSPQPLRAAQPAAASPVAHPAKATVAAPETGAPDLEFIELDADDLARLRGQSPAPDGAQASRPTAPPTEPPDAAPEAPADPDGFEFNGFVPAEDAFEGFGDLETTLSLDGGDAAVADLGPEDPAFYVGDDGDARLATAAMALQGADIRDEIGDVLLGLGGVHFSRRLLLIARRGRIVGWRGAGEGMDEERFRALDLDEKLPSIFAGLRDADSFWLGPLPPLPANRQLIEALGGPSPKDCLALPVVLRSKVVAHLYADNLDRGVAGAPLAEMKRLAAKAGLAFEVYILKNKIRRL